MARTVVISQPMFLPWLGMLEQACMADVFVHYDDVQFSKGSFSNRVQLKTVGGRIWLTAPLDRARSGKTIAETFMRPADEWRPHHLRSIRQALARAPHAEEALALAEELYALGTDRLSEFNILCLERLARLLGARTEFLRSSAMGVPGAGSPRVLGICRALGATAYVTGHGASDYLEHAEFDAAGVEVRYMDYACRPYPQPHGEFTPYVTVLDAIACCGQEARQLMTSRARNWREHVGQPR